MNKIAKTEMYMIDFGNKNKNMKKQKKISDKYEIL